MFLSRVKLDSSKRETQIALASPSRFHGSIEVACNDRESRKLWRIDTLNGEYYLLLLSGDIPDLSRLQKQFGFEDVPGETRDYQKLLDRIEEESIWRFRLVANPTVSRKQDDKDRGVVRAEASEKYMTAWFDRKAALCGFENVSMEPIVRQIKWYSFKKARTGQQVSFKSVTYEGFLKVKDVELFKKALLEGIGREKAYGMGLLTIVRV